MKKLVLAVALVVAFAAPAMAQDFPQGYNRLDKLRPSYLPLLGTRLSAGVPTHYY